MNTNEHLDRIGYHLVGLVADSPVRESLTAIREHCREVGEQLEFDRSAVADCLSAANRAIDERHWLTEGRGPYEWNDDRWYEEFYAAAVEIRSAIAPLTKIAANWKDCPQKGEDVAKARIDLKAENTALREQIAEMESFRYNLEHAYKLDMDALTAERDQAQAELTASQTVESWAGERIAALEAALLKSREVTHAAD